MQLNFLFSHTNMQFLLASKSYIALFHLLQFPRISLTHVFTTEVILQIYLRIIPVQGMDHIYMHVCSKAVSWTKVQKQKNCISFFSTVDFMRFHVNMYKVVQEGLIYYYRKKVQNRILFLLKFAEKSLIHIIPFDVFDA